MNYLKDNHLTILLVIATFATAFFPWLLNSNKEANKRELSIIEYKDIEMKDFWLFTNQGEIILDKKKFPVESAQIKYFLVRNISKKAIEDTDFIGDLIIKDPKNKILKVDSCTGPLTNSCNISSNQYQSTMIEPETPWKEIKGVGWAMSPIFLNSEDRFCVAVLYTNHTNAKKEGPIFQARLKNSTIKQYDSYVHFYRANPELFETLNPLKEKIFRISLTSYLIFIFLFLLFSYAFFGQEKESNLDKFSIIYCLFISIISLQITSAAIVYFYFNEYFEFNIFFFIGNFTPIFVALLYIIFKQFLYKKITG